MAEQEGVIKYRLEYRACELAATLDIQPLNAWRSLLYQLALIGQSPQRYGGLGYGNISQRIPGAHAFLITGTQTGHLATLTADDFAIVESAEPQFNRLSASGPSQPSSEALTHASVYQRQASANAVVHVHCPQLWRNTARLKLPHTAADIAYGSVAMALAVEALLESGTLASSGVFSMLGHEDGIVSFGDDLASAVQCLLLQLTHAIAIEQADAAR